MSTETIATLLADLRRGDRRALDALVPLLYDELRRIAHRQRDHRASAETMQTTVLVHEAYLRLAERSRLQFADEDHFLAASATIMRHILVDHARRRLAQKRGGGVAPLPIADDLDGGDEALMSEAEGLLELDGALLRLAELSPRLAEVVEMRFFAGFSVEETARLIGRDARTIKRDWQKARLLLAGMLGRDSVLEP